MINTHKKLLSFICATFLMIPAASQSSDGWKMAGFGALVGAAVGAACWACGESDTALIDRCQTTFNEGWNAWSGEVTAFCNFHTLSNPAVSVHSIVADEVNELHKTAQNLVQAQRPVKSYVNDMYFQLKTLKSCAASLDKRIHSLQSQYSRSAQDNRNLHHMKALHAQYNEFVPYFDLLYRFIAEHKPYFELYELESKLYTLYAQEMAYGNQYTNDVVALAQAIKQCVGVRYGNARYPYLVYESAIRSDISLLQSYIRQCNHLYPNRRAWAIQLEQYLRRVCGIICADSSYEKEKDAKRADDARFALQQQMREYNDALKKQARTQRDLADELARQQRYTQDPKFNVHVKMHL